MSSAGRSARPHRPAGKPKGQESDYQGPGRPQPANGCLRPGGAVRFELGVASPDPIRPISSRPSPEGESQRRPRTPAGGSKRGATPVGRAASRPSPRPWKPTMPPGVRKRAPPPMDRSTPPTHLRRTAEGRRAGKGRNRRDSRPVIRPGGRGMVVGCTPQGPARPPPDRTIPPPSWCRPFRPEWRPRRLCPTLRPLPLPARGRSELVPRG